MKLLEKSLFMKDCKSAIELVHFHHKLEGRTGYIELQCGSLRFPNVATSISELSWPAVPPVVNTVCTLWHASSFSDLLSHLLLS